MIGAFLVIGVVIISRPPALFPDTKDYSHNTTDNKGVSENFHEANPDCKVKEPYDMVGLGFALAVPFLSAWMSIITRELRHIHYSVLVFWFAIGGLVTSSLGILCLDSVPLFHEWNYVTWLLSLQQAVLGIVGSVLMTKAVCWLSPAKTMVIRSFQVIISYIVQVINTKLINLIIFTFLIFKKVEFFGTYPHVSDYFGAFLIMTAVFTITAEDKIMKTFSTCPYC